MDLLGSNGPAVAQFLAILVSLAVLAGYEYYLRRAGARSPMKTARSAHALIRREWVKGVVGRPGTEIVVIQTLRNSVMAASFMASTAALALIGTLTLTGLGNPGGRLWHHAPLDILEEVLLATKLLLLAATFFLSFLLSAMAVRFFNHAGYLITGKVAESEIPARQDLAAAYLNRAGHQYSMGLRTFFACMPFMAGLFNTYLMLPAALLLVFIFYRFDQVPGVPSSG